MSLTTPGSLAGEGDVLAMSPGTSRPDVTPKHLSNSSPDGILQSPVKSSRLCDNSIVMKLTSQGALTDVLGSLPRSHRHSLAALAALGPAIPLPHPLAVSIISASLQHQHQSGDLQDSRPWLTRLENPAFSPCVSRTPSATTPSKPSLAPPAAPSDQGSSTSTLNIINTDGDGVPLAESAPAAADLPVASMVVNALFDPKPAHRHTAQARQQQQQQEEVQAQPAPPSEVLQQLLDLGLVAPVGAGSTANGVEATVAVSVPPAACAALRAGTCEGSGDVPIGPLERVPSSEGGGGCGTAEEEEEDGHNGASQRWVQPCGCSCLLRHASIRRTGGSGTPCLHDLHWGQWLLMYKP